MQDCLLVYTPVLFTAKAAVIYSFSFVSCCVVKFPAEMQYVVAHLGEVDILCGCEVEALLVALMLQKTLCEPIRYFHIAAVVLFCVRGGVGQHGCCLLNLYRIQERGVSVELVRLEEGKKNRTT